MSQILSYKDEKGTDMAIRWVDLIGQSYYAFLIPETGV